MLNLLPVNPLKRFYTREVRIGNSLLGGNNPIRLQSMTTTDTMDTHSTVNQCIRMIEAGCEYIRLTAPSINEAKNLAEIKKELKNRGFSVPLIADIHYTPNAAEWAARIVEKVRINPGNYADKKQFKLIDYTEADYQQELDRIRERFIPLVKICKEYGTAMRIGTNHGSLSDRILSRYGDTPEGMVESAFDFLKICEEEGFRNIVLSMKASNTQIMVQAYRLLVKRMMATNRDYPLHLGVTEAGDGEDGRIKSAVGIGTLLDEGIGDTIRVSLTEDPEFELPVAKVLASRYFNRYSIGNDKGVGTEGDFEKGVGFEKGLGFDKGVGFETDKGTILLERNEPAGYSPFAYQKLMTQSNLKIGAGQPPVIIADLSERVKISFEELKQVGYSYNEVSDKWNFSDLASDFIYAGDQILDETMNIPPSLGIILNANKFFTGKQAKQVCPYFNFSEWKAFLKNGRNEGSEGISGEGKLGVDYLFVGLRQTDFASFSDELWRELPHNLIWVLTSEGAVAVEVLRRMAWELAKKGNKNPIVIQIAYPKLNEAQTQLYAAADLGALLLDGIGDGIWIQSAHQPEFINRVGFGILQASRTRISKTEYISCPSCGRTLFDLQETTAKIKAKTDHLKGLKIGIMGCIVNGPGEMADADYGYVGTGIGKITLYKGKEVMKRNIASQEAVDELIGLIKEHGDWIDPT